MIDTHCHLDFESYDADRADVIERARSAGVDRILVPGIDIQSIEGMIALTETYPEMIALALGVHPNSTNDWDEKMLKDLSTAISRTKVFSIGEIGLDYYWDKSPRTTQITAFQQQLVLAAEAELPVIIHNRDASEDVIAILEEWAPGLPRSLVGRAGVLHSFSGSHQVAQRALELGFYIGFTGPITFRNAEETRRIAAQVPLERILVETDGPFLTPHPYRGKRNEPAYIPLIVERLAALHDVDTLTMAQHTTANAQHLFRLSD